MVVGGGGGVGTNMIMMFIGQDDLIMQGRVFTGEAMVVESSVTALRRGGSQPSCT